MGNRTHVNSWFTAQTCNHSECWGQRQKGLCDLLASHHTDGVSTRQMRDPTPKNIVDSSEAGWQANPPHTHTDKHTRYTVLRRKFNASEIHNGWYGRDASESQEECWDLVGCHYFFVLLFPQMVSPCLSGVFNSVDLGWDAKIWISNRFRIMLFSWLGTLLW